MDQKQREEAINVAIIDNKGYELLGGQQQQPKRRPLWRRALLVLGIVLLTLMIPLLYNAKLEVQRRPHMGRMKPCMDMAMTNTKQMLHEKVPLKKRPGESRPGLPLKLDFDPITLEADMYSMLDIDVRHGTIGSFRLTPHTDPKATTLQLQMSILGHTERQLNRVLVEKALVFDLFKGTMQLHLSVDGPHRNLMTDGPVQIDMQLLVPLAATTQGLHFYGESLDILIDSSMIMKFDLLNLGTGNGKIQALGESLLMAKEMQLFSTNGDLTLFGLAYRDSVMLDTERGSIFVPALFPHRTQANDYRSWSVTAHAHDGNIRLVTPDLEGLEFKLKAENGKADLVVPSKEGLTLREDEEEVKSGVYGVEGEKGLEGMMDVKSVNGSVEWKVDTKVKVVDMENEWGRM